MHRLVVADDHPVVFHAVRAALPSPAFRIVAECTRGEDALVAVRTHKAGLLVLDLQLPGLGGIEVLRRLRTLGARVRVLVLSAKTDADGGIRAMRAGADGYVSKSATPADLSLAIELVARGRPFFRPVVTQALSSEHRTSPPRDDDALLGSLTDREFDILKALAAGQSNIEIAGDLAIPSKTVSAIRVKLMRKLGTSNLRALIEFAQLNNIVAQADPERGY